MLTFAQKQSRLDSLEFPQGKLGGDEHLLIRIWLSNLSNRDSICA